MRILTLNYEFPPLGGGASPVTYEIATGLQRLGHTVDVVTMGFRGLPAREDTQGVRVFRVPCWRSKKEVCQPWEQATYLWSADRLCHQLIKQQSYHLCHAHFLIPTGLLARRIYRKFQLPYIVTSHGSDVPGFNEDRFTILHRFTRPVLRGVISDAARVTTPSLFLKQLIEREVVGKAMPSIAVLPNGSRSLADDSISKDNTVVSLGRLLPRKGFQYTIGAFRAIARADWRLVIIGDGPYRAELERIASGDRRITFTGWLDNRSRQLSDWINRARIFMLLSKSESQGIVFLEAMSAGCAIIAARGTASSETVTPDVGRLVKPASEAAAQKALVDLMEHPETIERMARMARQRYRERYRWEFIIRQYDQLFQAHARL